MHSTYQIRFYSSVLKAREIIELDGGVESFNFEFTEWSHQIIEDVKNTQVLKNWFLANSSHVIDLAFYLGGKPQKIQSYAAGGNDWHPAVTIFAGAGITHATQRFIFLSSQLGSPGTFRGANFDTTQSLDPMPSRKITDSKNKFYAY